VKGRTADPGLDVDTAYGQLLRRMTDDNVQVRYAVVAPTHAIKAAPRVPAKARQGLRIDIYEVTTTTRSVVSAGEIGVDPTQRYLRCVRSVDHGSGMDHPRAIKA
jgi:hypothetical protein